MSARRDSVWHQLPHPGAAAAAAAAQVPLRLEVSAHRAEQGAVQAAPAPPQGPGTRGSAQGVRIGSPRFAAPRPVAEERAGRGVSRAAQEPSSGVP